MKSINLGNLWLDNGTVEPDMIATENLTLKKSKDDGNLITYEKTTPTIGLISNDSDDFRVMFATITIQSGARFS